MLSNAVAPASSQVVDWLWEILSCPECGAELEREGETHLLCTRDGCGYRGQREGRMLNLLPRALDQHQQAEHTFRERIADRLKQQVPHMNDQQYRTFRLLNTIMYYSFTSQYYFFRDEFTKRHTLRGRGLEIGSATGQSSGLIKLFYPDVEMVSSDVAPINTGMAELIAQQLGFETECFVTADAERPPFKPQSFDFMFSSGMLHHLGDLPLALRKGHELLRPGGRWYVINELSIGSLPRRYWNSSIGKKGKWAKQTGVREYSYTLNEWLTFFKQANFEVVDLHFHTNPRHKLESWSRSAYYALLSKLPRFMLRMGIPCEVNFVLQKR